MARAMNNKVASITVTYNPDVEVLTRQINSLINQVETILVVDNGSENIDSVRRVRELSEKIKIIELGENKGIAHAQNVGIRLVLDDHSHVILFDHDSEITDKFVSGLLTIESNLLCVGTNVAAVGPSFFNPETSDVYPVPVINDNDIFPGLFLSKKTFKDNEQYLDSYFLIASGCLIRTLVLKEIGLMDDDLFIDNVDVEWCLRARVKGYRVFTSSSVKMIHRIGDSSRKVFGKRISVHSNIRKYYNTRNNLFLIKYKGAPSGIRLRMAPSMFVRFVIGILDTNDRIDYISKYYWALYDFLRNKKGKFNH